MLSHWNWPFGFLSGELLDVEHERDQAPVAINLSRAAHVYFQAFRLENSEL